MYPRTIIAFYIEAIAGCRYRKSKQHHQNSRNAGRMHARTRNVLQVSGQWNDTTMSATQYFPLPPELFAHACDTVSKRVSQLPFLRGGVHVTGELVGVTMECLNAEPSRTLPLTTPRDIHESVTDGLDLCLEQRLRVPGKTFVPVIAEVLCSAGIAEMTEIIDRELHRPRRAIRLLAPWTWHIASTMAPSVRLGGSGGADRPCHGWTSCPVCRTGILDRVMGKQLFGIPRTDFYHRMQPLRRKIHPGRPGVPAGLHCHHPRPALEKASR